MLQNVFYNFSNTLRCSHRSFNVDSRHIFIFDTIFFLNCIHIVDAERKNISVIDSIYNGISVELVTEGLRCGQHFHVLSFSGIGCKNRCTSKSKQMIFFERLYNFCVHISELAAVALVKDNHAMLIEHFMSFVLSHEVIQLLNGCDDDFILMIAAFFVPVLKLSLQYSCRSIAVGRTFLKAVIFFHGLIVKVFSINHKQNLVHIRKCRCKLCGLKRSQRFSASRSVPDIASCINRSHLFVVGRNLDAV